MNEFLPPEAKKILILSPHPDDESLGCSGTILLYTGKGIDVYLIVISNGEKAEVEIENIGEIRKCEATASAALLGIKKTIFLDFPDKEITAHKEHIKKKLSEIIKDINPDIIFAPFPVDPHPDHRATSEIALMLMPELPGFKLAFYEIYHPIRFNVLVDISSVIQKKREAILTYEKSLLGIPEIFWYAIESLNAYRSLVYRRKSFYEAFWLIDTPVSKDEVVKWATFDYYDTPAEIFLSQLKVADKLIFELQNAYGLIETKDAEISNLRKTLQETERKLLAEISNLRKTLQETERKLLEEVEKIRELETSLDLLMNSLSWKFIKNFYSFRDKILPDGTGRRNLYNKMIGKLKKVT